MPGVLHGAENFSTFAIPKNMVPIVQLVRMSDCGSEGRGFEPHLAPLRRRKPPFFCYRKTDLLNQGRNVEYRGQDAGFRGR